MQGYGDVDSEPKELSGVRLKCVVDVVFHTPLPPVSPEGCMPLAEIR
jgi:hypothetical protein